MPAQPGRHGAPNLNVVQHRRAQAVAVQDADAMPDHVRHAIEEAMVTSDLEVARKGARLLQAHLAATERELMLCKDRLAYADSYLLSIAAAKRERRRVGGKEPVDDGPQLPEATKNEGKAIHFSARKMSRIFFTFFSVYVGKHVWDYAEVGWGWEDAEQRFDPFKPKNWKIGRMLELVAATDEEGHEWIKEGNKAYQEQFETALSVACSDAMKRIRDNGAEIFKDLKEMINAGFDQYYETADAEPLTYTRKRQDAVTLDGFGNELFFPDSNAARRNIPGIDKIIGIWETKPGVFESRPLDALIIYQNYQVQGGEEFASDALFRLCRSLIYGATSMGQKTRLALDKRSPLKGFKLDVTPGLIVGTVTLARIALSPEETFSGDGKGPITKVRFDDDAEEMLEGLMRIWEEPGGHRIREKWRENIFPSTMTGQWGSTDESGSTEAPPARQRGQAAAQMAARNREALGTQANAANQEAGDSYHIPRDSFYDDRDHSRNFSANLTPLQGYPEDKEDGAEDSDSDAEKDYTLILDEDQGRVLRAPRPTLTVPDFLPDPSHNDQLPIFEPDEAEPTVSTSSPPRTTRARNPPMLVAAVSRSTSTSLVPSRAQSVASRGATIPRPGSSVGLIECRPSGGPSSGVKNLSGPSSRSVSQTHTGATPLTPHEDVVAQPPPSGPGVLRRASQATRTPQPDIQEASSNETVEANPAASVVPTDIPLTMQPEGAPIPAQRQASGNAPARPVPRRVTRRTALAREDPVLGGGVGGDVAIVPPALAAAQAEGSGVGSRGRGGTRARGQAPKKKGK